MLAGLSIFVAPQLLDTVARYGTTATGLYAAAAVRVGIGLLVLKVASMSRAPRTLRVAGGILVLAGIATAFMSVELARSLADWFLALGPTVIRLCAVVVLTAGASFAYAVTPRP